MGEVVSRHRHSTRCCRRRCQTRERSPRRHCRERASSPTSCLSSPPSCVPSSLARWWFLYAEKEVIVARMHRGRDDDDRGLWRCDRAESVARRDPCFGYGTVADGADRGLARGYGSFDRAVDSHLDLAHGRSGCRASPPARGSSSTFLPPVQRIQTNYQQTRSCDAPQLAAATPHLPPVVRVHTTNIGTKSAR